VSDLSVRCGDELQVLYDQMPKLLVAVSAEVPDFWEIGGLVAQMEHQLHRIGLELPPRVRQQACAVMTHGPDGRLLPEFTSRLVPQFNPATNEWQR